MMRPYERLRERGRASWACIFWGWERTWLDLQDVAAYAERRVLDAPDNQLMAVSMLATLPDRDLLIDEEAAFKRLANEDSEGDERIELRWLLAHIDVIAAQKLNFEELQWALYLFYLEWSRPPALEFANLEASPVWPKPLELILDDARESIVAELGLLHAD